MSLPVPILQAPNKSLWTLGVDLNGSIVTTATGSGQIESITLQDSSLGCWTLGVSNLGLPTTTSVAFTPGAVQYILLAAPNNQIWELQVSTGGLLTTNQFGLLPPTCNPPIPQNIKESQFPYLGIFHSPTGNPITVLADYGLYCCALASFVRPEDTNLIEILDE